VFHPVLATFGAPAEVHRRRMADRTRSEATMPEYEVTRVTALSESEARGFVVGREEIVLCKMDGEVYAFQGLCSHEALPLDGGEVEDGVLTCEWHGAQFDVRTGAVCSPPASVPLRGYDTRVDEEGRVFVTIG
jgi:nitrite reductase/ring-hydroxylating ferredoxin subunit